MTQIDRFMRSSIKRRFSLTTLLQVSRLAKDLREDEMEIRFRDLNRILEESSSEQEFCQMVFESTYASHASEDNRCSMKVLSRNAKTGLIKQKPYSEGNRNNLIEYT